MVGRAFEELSVKTLRQIQQDTALTWAARFYAALRMGIPADETEELRHEAVEHAALAGDIDLVQTLNATAPR